jgi:hypothetical protein
MLDDERFEQLIAFIDAQLPTPVDRQTARDGSMIFIGGAPPEVVVQLAESSVRVSEYFGVWESPDRLTVKPRRLGVLKWRRLPETSMMQALAALVKGAREMRLARYRSCPVCDKRYPPEVLFVNDVCPWCTESDSVVH